MKLIVETNGDFQIVVPGVDNHAHFDRPSVVNHLHLFQTRIGTGELKVLAQVNDDATDAAFFEVLTAMEGKTQAAVDAFASEFPLPVEAEPEADPEAESAKTGRGAKKTEAPE